MEELNIKKGVSQSLDPATAAGELFESLNQDNISLALFYCSLEIFKYLENQQVMNMRVWLA